MSTTAHDFVTVEMRGLKAALVARARAERVSVSVLVRGAVARDLGLAADVEASRMDALTAGPASAASVKMSIRMREIGFYDDLSDAYNAQTIRPRYELRAEGSAS